MSYIYQAQTPLSKERLAMLEEKLQCEIRYDENGKDGHYYVINRLLNLEVYGLELVIGIADKKPESKPQPK